MGFTDYLAATILACTEYVARETVDSISAQVENWLKENWVKIARHNIDAAKVLQHLSVMVDKKLTF